MADTANDNAGKSAEERNETPPWGNDFDAETAWKLVKNLRADKQSLTEARDELQTKLTAAESASSEATTKLEAAESARDEATRGLSIQKALRAHPDLEGYEEFLTGDDEEAILAKAARLSKIGAKDGGDDPDGKKPKGDDGDDGKPKDDEDDDENLPGRPEPKLRPGHGGDDPEEPFDPAALAKEVRESGRY